MPTRYSLSKILQEIGLPYSGRDIDIWGQHTLAEANATHISFLAESKYFAAVKETKAGAVLIRQEHLSYLPEGVIPIVTEDPYLSMALLSKVFHTPPQLEKAEPSVGEACQIAEGVICAKGVRLGDRVTIMAGCVIGEDTVIGSDTILYPNVSLYHDTVLGCECRIHSGVVIGADGYGFAAREDGSQVKIYQNGNVRIGDRVEIGANSTIDRAAFGSTTIGSGTKIDNLVQVAHNCEIGKDCLLVCQTALAGSTKLGDGVIMGGQSGATGHLEIGDHATIASRAGVTKSLSGGKVYGGFPAIEQKLWLKIQAKLQRLIKKK